MRWTRRDWARFGLAVLTTSAAIFVLVFLITAIAKADGGKHDKPTTTEATTTSSIPEETTTTQVLYVEVCVDEAIILVPWEPDLDDKYEVIKTDRDRKKCLPKEPTPTVPTLPGPVIQFPPYTVGYICPGTDGVVVELPWGTYDEMFPTPEQAAQACPTTTIPAEYVTTPERARPETLPFTGIPVWAWVLASIIMLGGGISLVRSIEEEDDEPRT